MSPNSKSKKNINQVSATNELNIDVQKIYKVISKENNEEDEYEKFCQKYTGENFEMYNVTELKRIYEIGNALLYQYFVTKDSSCDNDILIQLQYIINSITYNIFMKQSKNLKEQNIALNTKLTKTVNRAEKLEKDSAKRSTEIRHVKKDMKSITTTIISIILAISIIPTAIAGIEHISGNYILPFLSSVILFGMIMITFVYSIYQDKIKVSTWIILIFSLIFTIVLWINSINPIININNNSNTTEETFENSQEEELATN